MHKVIRDDVISLESYIAAAFKYDSLLETMLGVGGYVFVIQLKAYYGVTKAKRIIKGAEKANLIKSVAYSNCKYISLTITATKYLACKRVGEKELINTYKKIDPYPSDRKLFASAFKFHLFQKGYSFMTGENYEKRLKDYLRVKNKWLPAEKLKEEKDIYVSRNYEKIVLARKMALQLIKSKEELSRQIGKQLANDVLEYRNAVENFDSRINQSEEFKEKEIDRISKGISLFNISKIVLLPEDECLRLIIFDVGDIKTISGYMKNIEGFEKVYGIKFSRVEIEFKTYDENRFRRFEKKVNIALKDVNKRRLNLKAYDDDLEMFKTVKDSKSIAEGVVKKKDERKFDEIIKTLEG